MSSTTTTKPASKQAPRKLTKDQKLKEEQEQKELERLERERLEEEQRKPKEFTDLEFVESCLRNAERSSDELTAFLAHELRLEDYLINLRSSILVDFNTYNIEYVYYVYVCDIILIVYIQIL
jgi:hypothetical protein